jgi:uncharacterized membrane protein
LSISISLSIFCANFFKSSVKEEHSLLVVHDHRNGRVLALTTDVAPHWVGGMVDWGSRIRINGSELGDNYIRFLHNVLNWLAKE